MKIIAVTGQTATGKTALAIQKAMANGGELVNFDSRQIYRHLDIITGKDFTEKNFMKVRQINGFDVGYYTVNYQDSKVKIWLYDIIAPNQYFSSFDFSECARDVIKDIINRGKIPVLVGGTYLYLYHLLYQVDTQHIPPDLQLRQALKDMPVPALQEKLNMINPAVLKQLNQSEKNNPQRLIRKIEIASLYQHKGKPVPLEMKYELNSFFKDKEIEITGLAFGKREEALKTIALRVKKRIQSGAFQEVENLLNSGYSEDDYGLKTIGYRQIYSFMKGSLTREKAIGDWITAEAQYTKRQLTFMKKDPHIKWTYI